MSVEWERLLKKPAELACVACGAELGADMEVVTTLDFTDEGFLREDRCAPCFAKDERPHFSFWRRHLPSRPGPAPRKLDLAYLVDFFKRLQHEEGERERRVAWIVGLLLLRRRLVEEVGRTVRDGREVLTLRLKREDLEVELQDPRLDAATAEAIEEDLAQIFGT